MTSRLRSTLAFAAIAVLASASTVAVLNPTAAPTSIAQTAPDRPAPDSQSDSSLDGADLAGLTPTEKEYLYVPIKPCRIVDTRKAGGKLAVNEQRAFVVKGTTAFVPQGGTSGGCGIPAGATSATFSFTTTEATGKGRLNAWPNGVSEPGSTVLSYTNANKVTSNPTVALQQTGSPHLRVRNYDYSTHLVVDVTGYYIGQMYAYVNSGGTLGGSSRVVSAAKIGTGMYNVTFDTPLTGCVAVANADWGGYIANALYTTSSPTVTVVVYNHAGVAADYYFNLAVHC
ncbi:hypothetical protein [Microbacterium sp. CFBP9034]|uniref:hypothetical protein n=1 Tax=Microbacterium sp. CFBP9034 TaxID=3096540 RepID=UPI002A6B67CD|nr:hypothetical protein [Microbacterium sp. CFBP9034]MDY0908397.1 hypothetical protein [Microbacterium sp. CFBP9034]